MASSKSMAAAKAATEDLGKSFLRSLRAPRTENRTFEEICGKTSLPQAIRHAENMEKQGTFLDRDSAYFLVQDCEKLKDVESGRRVRFLMVHSGLDAIAVLSNHLIRLFTYNRSLPEANQVFEKIGNPCGYTWAAILSANNNLGNSVMAIRLYQQMEIFDMKSDQYIYAAILRACGAVGDLLQGRFVHHEIVETPHLQNVAVGSTLVDMYAKCGSLEEACIMFDKLSNKNIVSWGAMITGYAQHGEALLALDYYEKMQQEGIKPDRVIFLSVLKACASINTLPGGRFFHDIIIDGGLEADVIVGNTLVNMYAKCGSLEEALNVFDMLPNRDLVSWNAMIAGYTQQGEGVFALDCFEEMPQDLVKPDAHTYSSVLRACASIGALNQGRLIHKKINECGLGADVVVKNALIDMYATSGNLEEALALFSELSGRNIVSWNSMIAGYAQHGEGFQSVVCFNSMGEKGIVPDEASFTSILTACSHGGLIEEGRWYFKLVVDAHSIGPTISHCSCMIDLLSRAGFLQEAKELLQASMQTDSVGWMSLLSACKRHGNAEIARQCFDQIVSLGLHSSAGYTLMSSICTDAHMQEEAHKLEKLRKCALAWIEMDKKKARERMLTQENLRMV